MPTNTVYREGMTFKEFLLENAGKEITDPIRRWDAQNTMTISPTDIFIGADGRALPHSIIKRTRSIDALFEDIKNLLERKVPPDQFILASFDGVQDVVVLVSKTVNIDDDFGVSQRYWVGSDNIVKCAVTDEYVLISQARNAILPTGKRAPVKASYTEKFGDTYFVVKKGKNLKNVPPVVQVFNNLYQPTYQYQIKGLTFVWMDGTIHDEEEKKNFRLSYHHSSPKNLAHDQKTDIPGSPNGMLFTFGVEIEKNNMPDFDYSPYTLLHMGHVFQRDSSVGEGFELATATFNLFSSQAIDELKKLSEFIAIPCGNNCGGHMGFGISGKTGRYAMEYIEQWLPLIFAMFPGRVRNSFCSVTTIKDMKECPDHYRAVRPKRDFLEIRIFGAIRSFRQLMFRIMLLRHMVVHHTMSFKDIVIDLVDENSKLHHMFRTYGYQDADKFQKLVQRTINLCQHHTDIKIDASFETEVLKLMKSKTV